MKNLSEFIKESLVLEAAEKIKVTFPEILKYVFDVEDVNQITPDLIKRMWEKLPDCVGVLGNGKYEDGKYKCQNIYTVPQDLYDFIMKALQGIGSKTLTVRQEYVKDFQKAKPETLNGAEYKTKIISTILFQSLKGFEDLKLNMFYAVKDYFYGAKPVETSNTTTQDNNTGDVEVTQSNEEESFEEKCMKIRSYLNDSIRSGSSDVTMNDKLMKVRKFDMKRIEKQLDKCVEGVCIPLLYKPCVYGDRGELSFVKNLEKRRSFNIANKGLEHGSSFDPKQQFKPGEQPIVYAWIEGEAKPRKINDPNKTYRIYISTNILDKKLLPKVENVIDWNEEGFLYGNKQEVLDALVIIEPVIPKTDVKIVRVKSSGMGDLAAVYGPLYFTEKDANEAAIYADKALHLKWEYEDKKHNKAMLKMARRNGWN